MSIMQTGSSKVTVQEINLSQVITSASSSVAAQTIVSLQGSTQPMLWTNAQDYLNHYGNPNPAVGLDIYAGLDYFKEGSQLWGVRVAGSGALTGGVLLWSDGTSCYLAPLGSSDPANPNWNAANPGGSVGYGAQYIPIAYFFPIQGPGVYSNKYSVSLSPSGLVPPAVTYVINQGEGQFGNLVGTLQYYVSTLTAAGESPAVSVPVTIVGSTPAAVTLTIAGPVANATGYRIYGRSGSSAQIGLLATIGINTTFTDTGALIPNVSIQPNTGAVTVANNAPFTVNFYDTSVNPTSPKESYLVTLLPGVDGNGVATEMEDRINPFSTIMNVTSNVAALPTLPTITLVGQELVGGGADGAAVQSSDIINALQAFTNKQLYKINILINGGHADPATQLAMDTLVQNRGDCVALLDVPSAMQSFQNAITYRNINLNLNSTYSALFTSDLLEQDSINGKQQYVPFSGMAAALCARTDRVANPSFSIAGLNRGIVNVLKTRYVYDDGECDALFDSQVNYTKTLIGQGTSLWEQQTLASQTSALSWLSVRRIVNVLKTSVISFLVYSLQEPNDDFTGRQIVGSCQQYLDSLVNSRALTSGVCISDSSNNPAANFNAGIRTVSIIIIPMIPIHQIELQVVISKQGVNFSEILTNIQQQ